MLPGSSMLAMGMFFAACRQDTLLIGLVWVFNAGEVGPKG
jgi:hypothetical protein